MESPDYYLYAFFSNISFFIALIFMKTSLTNHSYRGPKDRIGRIKTYLLPFSKRMRESYPTAGADVIRKYRVSFVVAVVSLTLDIGFNIGAAKVRQAEREAFAKRRAEDLKYYESLGNTSPNEKTK